MQLHEAIAAAGMTPPKNFSAGKWLRFPGAGKDRSNRAGWCRVISPSLAVFGDWSSGLTEVWRDGTQRDDAETQRILEEARHREKQFAAEQAQRARAAARRAGQMLEAATDSYHPYLIAKGFKTTFGLVQKDQLLIPMYDVEDYSRLLGVQNIAPDGTKRFLLGARTKGGIYRLGQTHPLRTLLCEGFATGLTLQAALKLLPWRYAVIVCFSAGNLVTVAERFPQSVIAADNDKSGTGERAARETGLKWVMPPDVDTDFNDMHRAKGLMRVLDVLREALK